MKIKFNPVVILLFFSLYSFSQTDQSTIERIEPPFWWVGMEESFLQLLVYGENICDYDVELESNDVSLNKVIPVENPNYLFLNLAIPEETDPGTFVLNFTHKQGNSFSYNYELKERKVGSKKRVGFGPSDVIYLLMPDRFANGDPANDSMPGMYEPANSEDQHGRHGGDLQGVIDHMDYLNGLGITALWMNPFLENNNPEFSYHGYAISDFYKTDPRMGTNETFLELVEMCHQNGIKVIMDQVFNHCSLYHWFIEDMPTEDWIHQFPEYTRSNFRAPTITDPYASEFDRTRMLTGWFDRHMPDLNQKNELLANYLIQNSIWWIEYADLDGIRLDTQPYSYKEMVAEWGKRVFEEYPDFNIVGEAWLQKIAITSFFQENQHMVDGYNSNLPSVTDFPLHYALEKAFLEEEGWTTGMARLYYILAQDFLYANPNMNVVFLDNHDLSRYYSVIDKDFDVFQMAFAYLVTTRGIPMVYYGTEILKTGHESDGHGHIRTDFPGGWPGDESSAFTSDGRTKKQNQAFDYCSHLLNWRKGKDVIHNGQLKHFVPDDGVYVLFRYNEEETIMLILNNNKKKRELNTDRFVECMEGFKKGYDVINDKKVKKLNTLEIPGKTAMILEFKK